jgi:hypothetical protein
MNGTRKWRKLPRPIWHRYARVLLQINAVAREDAQEFILVASRPLLRNLLESDAFTLANDLLNLLTSFHFLEGRKERKVLPLKKKSSETGVNGKSQQSNYKRPFEG